ncbi:MAG: alpha/beta fold hydrolase [Saprospiraceae bacterium]
MKIMISLFLGLFISFDSLAFTDDSTSGIFTSFDKTKIYYETHGQGKPVLFIHGFTSTGDSWKKSVIYHELLKQNYKIILVDLRGNGKSDRPHIAEAYAGNAEAKDLMGLMKHLKIKSYEAMGYSRGSIILARLLVNDPHLTKAILGGIGMDFTNPFWPRRILFWHALAGDTIAESLMPMIKRIEDQGLDRTAQSLIQKEQPSTSKELLMKVQIPVLCISGDEDFDNGNAKELAQLFSKGVYKTVPGKHGGTSGTQAYADEVMKFIGAIGARTGDLNR